MMPESLKRKPATLKAFIGDLEWAMQYSTEKDQDVGTAVLPQNEDIGTLDQSGAEDLRTQDPLGDEDLGTQDRLGDEDLGTKDPLGDEDFGTQDPLGDEDLGTKDPLGDEDFGTQDPLGDEDLGTKDPLGDEDFGTQDPLGDEDLGTQDLLGDQETLKECKRPYSDKVFGDCLSSDSDSLSILIVRPKRTKKTPVVFEESDEDTMKRDTEDMDLESSYLERKKQEVHGMGEDRYIVESKEIYSDIAENSVDTSDSEVIPVVHVPQLMLESVGIDEIPNQKSVLEDNKHDRKHIARDIRNREIYISLVRKANISGKHTKTDRLYDTIHPCLFCSKQVANFSHHILSKQHASEEKVKEVLESTGKERKKAISRLRLKAAHLHNMNVLKDKCGEIFLLRRSGCEGESVLSSDEETDELDGQPTTDIRRYGPCPACLGWISLRSMKRHLKACSARDPDTLSSFSKNSLIVQSDIIADKVSDKASAALKNEVFSIMQNDDVGHEAKSDELIVQLGNQWMLRNRGNEIMRKYYTSSVMRLVAKLKKHCRTITNLKDENLDGFLQPKHFDAVVQAALWCCSVNGDEEDLLSPSNCIKLGHDIKRMLSTKLATAIKNDDDLKRKEAEAFTKLMDIEWGLRVTKLARSILNDRTFNQERQLPLPSDVKKLAEYLIKVITDLDLLVQTFAQFRKVAILNLARITLYNRRRCHEVQAMRLTAYSSRKTGIDQIGAEIRGDLTKFEHHLLEHQDVVVIRGKTGRGVPVILPPDVHDSLQYLSNEAVRRTAGIPSTNKYLFASAGAGVFRAYEAIREVTSDPKAGLQMPNLIRTSNMRKYMATMLQAMNTTESERQWVIDHLGHTMNVHQTHYRQTSDMLERVEVAKILLVQDLNLVSKYGGKKLADIQLDDIISTAQEEGRTSIASSDDVAPVTPMGNIDDTDDYIPDIEEEQEDHDSDELNEVNPKRKRPQPCQRQKWSAEEEKELKDLFQGDFAINKLPGQKRIEEMMKKSLENQGSIHQRKRDTIKKKLSNMMIKRRKSQN